MNHDAIKSMMNPLRMKIVHEISVKGEATTKELLDVCGDIPQATLYRHLNALLKTGILKIAAEKKVRGIMEKVYAINVNLTEILNKNPEDLSKEDLASLFLHFIIGLLSDFNNYLNKSEKINIVVDKIGFRSYPLYLTDEEFTEMMGEIYSSIHKRLDNRPANNRILRKFSTITTPYKEEGIEENDSKFN